MQQAALEHQQTPSLGIADPATLCERLDVSFIALVLSR
jgi:hypothetical protein